MKAADAHSRTGFNAPAVVLCGLAALILIYALSLFLEGGFLAAQARERRAKTETPVNETLRAATAAQEARLAESTRWLDDRQTKLVMPVAEAMDRIAAPAAPATDSEVTD